RIGGELHGTPDVAVTGLCSLDDAGSQDLSYVASDRYIRSALTSKAAAFLTHRMLPELNRPHIVVPHPAYAFARVAQEYFTSPYNPRGIAEPVARGIDVQIGPDPSIWPFVTIGDRATLGARVTLYPGVFVGADVSIGDDTVLF